MGGKRVRTRPERSLFKKKRRKSRRSKRPMSHKRALRRLGRSLAKYVQPGPITLAKKRAGNRSYINESRGNEILSVPDNKRYQVLGSHGCYGGFSTILGATGRDGALGSSTDPLLDYYVYNHKISYHFRNVSNHATFFEVYELELRKDHNIDTTTNTNTGCPQLIMNQLNEGWEQLAATGEFDNTGTGTVAAYSSGGVSIDTYMKTLTPFKSKNFVNLVKVVKTSRVKLLPGDDFWYNVRVKAHRFKHDEWFRGDDLQRREGAAGLTKILMVGIRGALGKSNANDAISGWVSSDVAFEIITRAKIAKMTETDDNLAVSFSADAIGAAVLEGPSEFEMKDEDQ